jgi:hypothetical protein
MYVNLVYLVDRSELIIPTPVAIDIITAKKSELVISQNTVTWNKDVIENIRIAIIKNQFVRLK